MSFYWIGNTFGTTCGATGVDSGTIASGYDVDNLLSGHRSLWARTQANASEHHVFFDNDTPINVDAAVIAGAHKMLTLATAVVEFSYNTDGLTTFSPLQTYNPLTSSDLMGPYSQDLAITFTEVGAERVACSFNSSGTEAAQLCKMYYGSRVELTTPPQPGAVWQRDEVAITPIKPHYGIYQTEAVIDLLFLNCTQDDVDSWKSIDGLQTQPVFIFDDAADLWDYKLEHVLVESWTELVRAEDQIDLTVRCRRLKHYE